MTKSILETRNQFKNQVDIDWKIVYLGKTTSNAQIQAFNQEYNFDLPYLIKKNKKFARKFNVTTTPECIIVNDNNNVVYQGAINNWYTSLGKYLDKPTAFYLNDAIESIIKNEDVKVKKTVPVGCFL